MKRLSQDSASVAEVLEILVLREEFLIRRSGNKFLMHGSNHVITVKLVACNNADISIMVIRQNIDRNNTSLRLIAGKQSIKIHAISPNISS